MFLLSNIGLILFHKNATKYQIKEPKKSNPTVGVFLLQDR